MVTFLRWLNQNMKFQLLGLFLSLITISLITNIALTFLTSNDLTNYAQYFIKKTSQLTINNVNVLTNLIGKGNNGENKVDINAMQFKFVTNRTYAEILLCRKSYCEQKREKMPSFHYEINRRRVLRDIENLWIFVNSKFIDATKELTKFNLSEANNMKMAINEILERKRSIEHSMHILQKHDGYESARGRDLRFLSKLVQRRFQFLQNPLACHSAKKLVCDVRKDCGFGCQIHHVVYCFIVAYATERTLVLLSHNWKYAENSWEDIFEPISNTCTELNDGLIGTSSSMWPGTENTQILILPPVEFVKPLPNYLPLAIPEDLEPHLMKIHEDPTIWWISQIVKFILKPKKKMRNLISRLKKDINFTNPIVGVHVRRTDKVSSGEAKFHFIYEYMAAVNQYFKKLDLQHVHEKKIYVATDSPSVFKTLRDLYPEFTILGNPKREDKYESRDRFGISGLEEILKDLFLLSQCDHLVVTFSSHIGRLAYEIMNSMHNRDVSQHYTSLDDNYYFGGQLHRMQIAILPHKPKGITEVELIVGNLIIIKNDSRKGYYAGINLRTNQFGFYPSFKVENYVQTSRFPLYPKASLHPKKVSLNYRNKKRDV